MKTSSFFLTVTASIAFICSYFMELTMSNAEQYLALVAVVFIDGFFGIMAGIKREGFKTFKGLKVLQRVITWIVFLTVILMVERGFPGTGWLSETIIVPFIILQLISALKNASMIGLIKSQDLIKLLDRIDLHKGDRE